MVGGQGPVRLPRCTQVGPLVEVPVRVRLDPHRERR